MKPSTTTNTPQFTWFTNLCYNHDRDYRGIITGRDNTMTTIVIAKSD